MSDEATHWLGCDSVHPGCHHPAERILLDLIAELRAHCREPSCGCDIGRAADHAESRLRAVPR